VVSNGETILVVDDEEIIRLGIKPLLNEFGFEVLLAESGEEAIQIFQSESANIDLVILDMVLPGINGSMTFKKMKEIDNHARIIMTSGFSKEKDVEDLKKEGLCAFIRKPFRKIELNKIIFSTLHSYR